MITREQAGAIATLLRTIPGRATWDQLATLQAVMEASVGRDLADTAYGALRCAMDPSITTPRGLLLEGTPHWRTRATPPAPRASPTEESARVLTTNPETRDRIAAYRAEARRQAGEARIKAKHPDLWPEARTIEDTKPL